QFLPWENILVVTDAPFVSPHPYRGKRNEPAFVRLVIEKLAALKNVSFKEAALRTLANTRKIFSLSLDT
ncbi:MAG: TatD family hydrolase, partial [Elusimicrobiales bacterium]